jgi:hypothetical protein
MAGLNKPITRDEHRQMAEHCRATYLAMGDQLSNDGATRLLLQGILEALLGQEP